MTLTVCIPEPEGAALLEPLPEGVEVLVWDGKTDPPDGIERTEFALIPASFYPFAKMLAAMPNLKVVQTGSAGVDYVRALVPEGAVLCNAGGVHGGSTAEWVLTAILAVLREIPAFVHNQERGIWDQHMTDELQGKRVLIIGAGDLGKNTAERVRAFDAEPILVARTARPEQGVYGTAEIPGLLPDGDIVVLVVPLTSETRGLADREFLARMRDGALLVNAARGPVVDTDALLAELHSGRLLAALDVTNPEPLPAEHPLWSAPGVLITSHVGGAVNGLFRRQHELVRAQIGRLVAGEPLINVISGEY